jgi:hypothetical protein
MQLPLFAREGRYLLRYLQTYEEVPHGAVLNQVFRPDARLVMSLVVSYDDRHADVCPGCRSLSDTTSSSTLRCACGVVYTRLSRSQDHIRMQFAHRKPLQQLEQATTPQTQASAQLPSRVDPLVDLRQLPTDRGPRFEIVKNIKNVDFSPPRMVFVRDLFGFMYIVPWRMVRTAEQVIFFLRQFTAGGSMLDWSRDYITVDDTNRELTVTNWETDAYPGISVALKLRDMCDEATLRQTLVSRIQDVLPLSAQTLRKHDFRDLVDEMCLLVGGTSAQIELRSLVEAAVNVQWLIQSAHDPTPMQAESASKSTCLICRQDFPTLIDLARHARTHLTTLRCQCDCDTCDRQSLLQTAKEDAGGHQEESADSSKVTGSGPVGYFGRFGSASHSPKLSGGAWVCCECRQANHPEICPSRCPIDGHYKCNRCYVYRPPPPPPPAKRQKR